MYANAIKDGNLGKNDLEVARIRLARIERVRKRFAECREQLTAASAQADREGNGEFDFELLLTDAFENQKFDRVIKSVSLGGTHYSTLYLVEAKLVAYALPGLKLYREIPTFEQMRKRKGLSSPTKNDTSIFVGKLDELETEIPLTQKLELVRDLTNDALDLPGCEKQLLGLAALIIWTDRNHLPQFQRLIRFYYSRLASNVLEDTQADPYGLFVRDDRTRLKSA